MDRYPFSVKPDRPITVPQADGHHARQLRRHGVRSDRPAGFPGRSRQEPARLSLGSSRTVRAAWMSSRNEPFARPRAAMCSSPNCGDDLPDADRESAVVRLRAGQHELLRSDLRRRHGSARRLGSSGQFHPDRPTTAPVELPVWCTTSRSACGIRRPSRASNR